MYQCRWPHGPQAVGSNSRQLHPRYGYGDCLDSLPLVPMEGHKYGDKLAAAEVAAPAYDYRCPAYCPHEPPRKFCYRRDPHQGRGSHRFNCSRCMQHEQVQQAATQDNASSGASGSMAPGSTCGQGHHDDGQEDQRQMMWGQDGGHVTVANVQEAEEDPTTSSIIDISRGGPQ